MMRDTDTLAHAEGAGLLRGRGILGWAVATALFGAAAATLPAAAQDVTAAGDARAPLVDTRWAPFIGCWEPVDAAPDAEGGVLCVRPSDRGVEMFSIREGEVRTSDVLVADGEPRAIRAEGCEGWEEVAFSADGRRAFTRSAYDCDGVSQSGSGVLALVSATQWVDVRAIEVDGERTSWVQRYRLVGLDRAAREGVEDPGFGMELASRAARSAAHRGVSFAQVEEASRLAGAEAVVAWLASRPEGFDPTAADLVALADAGVPEAVIDVVVAKSFPGTFQVDADGDAERAVRDDPRTLQRPGARRAVYFGPRVPFGFRMMGYGYGYVPADAFFYGYGYGYPGYWGYRPGAVIIERRPPPAQGRMIRGQGYTRPSGGESGTAVPRSGTGGSQPSAAPPRRTSPDEPSTREEPAPRRAQPRPPGG